MGKIGRIKSSLGGDYVRHWQNLLQRWIGGNMAGEETQEVIEADFQEKTVKKITVTEDTRPSKFLRDCAKIAKDQKIKSVMVCMVSEDNHCDWVFELGSEYHMALMALSIEYARDELKNYIFHEEEDFE